MIIIRFTPIGMVLDRYWNHTLVLALNSSCQAPAVLYGKAGNERFCTLTSDRSCLWYGGWTADLWLPELDTL